MIGVATSHTRCTASSCPEGRPAQQRTSNCHRPDEREIDEAARPHGGHINPMALKKRLAANIVTACYHGEAAAVAAGALRARGPAPRTPTEMPDVELPHGGDWPLIDLLVACKLATGKNDAKRLAEGGGVEYDGAKVTDARAVVTVRDGAVLRGRRRQFARLRVGG